MSAKAPYYYCGDTLLQTGRYYDAYLYVHVTIITCSVGAILNLLNLLVFTRKSMNSPPNMIFTHLAFVDLQQLLARLLSAWLKYIYDDDSEIRSTYGWLAFRKSYNAYLLTFHFISVFLTVQLAIWRYFGIVNPVKGRNWCNMRITRNVVIAGYIMCSISLGLPTYLTPEIKEKNENQKSIHKFTTEENLIMYEISSVVYGVMGRLLPSVILMLITYRLIVTLLARKQFATPANVKMNEQTNRSTTILFAVVALFFIAEFPKGILSLLRMIFIEESNVKPKGCYYSLISIFHSITNINISITFVVYYTLSGQFRNTFKSLFNCNKPTVSSQEDFPPPLPLGNITEITSSSTG